MNIAERHLATENSAHSEPSPPPDAITRLGVPKTRTCPGIVGPRCVRDVTEVRPRRSRAER